MDEPDRKEGIDSVHRVFAPDEFSPKRRISLCQRNSAGPRFFHRCIMTLGFSDIAIGDLKFTLEAAECLRFCVFLSPH